MADETLELKAEVVEPLAVLPKAYQWLAEIEAKSDEWEGLIKGAEPKVTDEHTYKAVKQSRSMINGFIKKIESGRADQTREAKALIREFELSANKLAEPLKAYSDACKAELDAYETRLADERFSVLAGYFAGIAPDLPEVYGLSFERFHGHFDSTGVWLRRTTSESKAKGLLDEALKELADMMDTVKQAIGDDEQEAKLTMLDLFKSLDIKDALQRHNQRVEYQRMEQERAEWERQQKEAARQAAQAAAAAQQAAPEPVPVEDARVQEIWSEENKPLEAAAPKVSYKARFAPDTKADQLALVLVAFMSLGLPFELHFDADKQQLQTIVSNFKRNNIHGGISKVER